MKMFIFCFRNLSSVNVLKNTQDGHCNNHYFTLVLLTLIKAHFCDKLKHIFDGRKADIWMRTSFNLPSSEVDLSDKSRVKLCLI